MKRKRNEKRILLSGTVCTALFVIWTLLVRIIDVKPVGPCGSAVGFAALNSWFHQLTGVHMRLYVITDWLSLVPIAVCMLFSTVGFIQWTTRRKLSKVDFDIILLGVYYVVVIAGYLFFEMVPVNYRPVLIDGMLEASYPSSTTLLVCSVMPTFTFQTSRRVNNIPGKILLQGVICLFTVFMAAGRLVSGVHWLTDIVGAVLLSGGLFYIYKGIVLIHDRKPIGRV